MQNINLVLIHYKKMQYKKNCSVLEKNFLSPKFSYVIIRYKKFSL